MFQRNQKDKNIKLRKYMIGSKKHILASDGWSK